MNATLIQQKPTRNKWEILVLIWVAFFLNQADRQAFNIVLPLIQEDIHLTDIQIGLIATIFNLFYAVLVPLGGWLGDKASRKWILTLTVIFWSVATMFTGLCSSFIALVIMRSVATGGGEALFGPNYLPLLAEYHKKTRAIAMSIVQIAYYIGVIASGWLAGWIGQTFGWRWTFIVFGVVGILHGLIMIWRLKDAPKTQEPSATPVKEKVSLLDGVRAIFSTRTARVMVVGYAALIFVLTGYLTWMPAYMYETFGMELKDAGFQSMLWTHCFAAVGILIAGWLADKTGAKRLEWRMNMQGLGLILAAPFILLMGNSTTEVMACVGLAGFGFFRSLFDANTYVVMFDVIPPKYHSSTSGILIMFGFGIGSLAPIILGVIKQHASLSTGISILGIIWLVAGVVMLIGSKLFYRKDYEALNNGSCEERLLHKQSKGGKRGKWIWWVLPIVLIGGAVAYFMPETKTEEVVEVVATQTIETEKPIEPEQPVKPQTVREKALQTIRGEYDNGLVRKEKLGDEYNSVQREVNKICRKMRR